jgi:hypothetical protein
MGNWGMKVSQEGYDVKTCADYQLLFSSAWPLFKIAAQGSFTIGDTTLDTTIATHNLGYVPFFIILKNSSNRISLDNNNYFVAMNGTDLKWQGATRSAFSGNYSEATYSGYYYIFRYNIQTAFTAPILSSTSASPGASGNYGIKVTKAGASIVSTDYRDYVIHSATRSPMIHKTGFGTFTLIGSSVVVTHSLTYEPLYFIFFNSDDHSDNRWQLALLSGGDFGIEMTDTTLTFTALPTGDYAYVILKDPFGLD